MKDIQIYRDYGIVDPKLLNDFETNSGVRFPGAYKTLILKHDALIPNAANFRFTNHHWNTSWPYVLSDGKDARDITFFGFGNSLRNDQKMSWNQDFDTVGHAHVIAFGIAANGDYICFDYRHAPETDEPKVVVMFHDAFDKDNKMLICSVADSFESFMDALYASA